jgi:cell wall-associated NlpC family hydrolase
MVLARTHRRAAGVVLAFVLAADPIVAASSATGDPIADKQRQAEEIATKLRQLEREVEANANQFAAAEGRLEGIRSEIAANEARLREAEDELRDRQHELATYAVNAYVAGGGAQAGYASLSSRSASQAGVRDAYNESATGDRQQLVDDLGVAKRETADQQARLDTSKRDAEQTVAAVDQRRKAADSATAQYRTLDSQVRGELRQLVAEKRAAEERAREAAAYQQALARAAAQRPATTGPPSAGASTASVALPAPPKPGAPPAAAPSDGSKGAAAVRVAMTKLGRPYVWGAAGPDSFDCSGLTQWAYRQVGVSIPRVTWDQERAGRVVPVSQIQAGDLVFYDGGGHMGMYVANGQVIHAPRTGDVVKISSLYMMPVELVVRVA